MPRREKNEIKGISIEIEGEDITRVVCLGEGKVRFKVYTFIQPEVIKRKK